MQEDSQMSAPPQIAAYLQGLFSKTQGIDWQSLAENEAKRLPIILAAHFDYHVHQGGFAQLIYNMQGELLAEMENMLISAAAPVAHAHYVRTIEACMAQTGEYFRFVRGSYGDDNALKDALHLISLDYFACKVPFQQEAFGFLCELYRRR